MNIGRLITGHSRYRPNHLAVVFGDTRLTYTAFNARVNRVANMLVGLGLRKGDKIATVLHNCLEQIELYWAIAKTGIVIVPLSPLLRGQGLIRLLNDSDSVAMVTDTNFTLILNDLRHELPHIKHYICTDNDNLPYYASYHALSASAPETEPPETSISQDDDYNIIYTSGTTGLPKGIVHTHFIRAMYCMLFASAYRMNLESIVLHTGALIFNGAMLTFMPAFYLGATYILHASFNPIKFMETVEREKVTHVKMVPSQIVALLNSPEFDPARLQSLEMIGSVGAPLHRAYKEALARHLPGRFYELYGLTEGLMTILDKEDFKRKMDSVGTPPAFQEIRIVDEYGQDVPANTVGEIIGHSPMLMTGYYKRPDLTEQAIRDGWLYSGDMGYLDDDGFLYLVDRKKDMIISGGVNIYPRDIEEIIVQHPAVREAAVFGVPDEKWGETPIAVVILKSSETIDAVVLCAWINERVEARFQRVSQVLIMSDFPRTVAGKTLKRVMRDDFIASRS